MPRVRLAVAVVGAVLIHALLFALSDEPVAKHSPERIEIAIVSTAPTPPAAPPTPARERAPVPAPKIAQREPPPVPVPPPETAQEAPPQPTVVEESPEQATWKEHLKESLAASSAPAPPRMPTGALAPSLDTLARVAAADPSLRDEENERRLAQNHSTFFLRGLEAIRRSWHPDDVLRASQRNPARAAHCTDSNRTTFAVAVLDKQGNVVDVDVKRTSGCDELDEEAIAAFKRVAQFPHPPAAIFVAADGTPMETARYPVRFIVTFDGGIQLDWRG